MAKLYFYHAAMNAGKSTVLLQSAHNYRERGMDVMLLTSSIDDRYGKGNIASRIGLKSKAELYDDKTNLWILISKVLEERKLSCILLDEAQFLKDSQVRQLAKVVDRYAIPVLAYGLRTDFLGKLFPGSAELMALAEELIEIKTICRCGRKAMMNARLNEDGRMVTTGNQIEVGGNDRYEAVCRRCYMQKSLVEQIEKEDAIK